MASYEYSINGDKSFITLYLPVKYEDTKTLNKLTKECAKLTTFCNSKLDVGINEQHQIKDNPIYTCNHCQKTFKKANGLTSHLKTCKSKKNNSLEDNTQ